MSLFNQDFGRMRPGTSSCSSSCSLNYILGLSVQRVEEQTEELPENARHNNIKRSVFEAPEERGDAVEIVKVRPSDTERQRFTTLRG